MASNPKGMNQQQDHAALEIPLTDRLRLVEQIQSIVNDGYKTLGELRVEIREIRSTAERLATADSLLRQNDQLTTMLAKENSFLGRLFGGISGADRREHLAETRQHVTESLQRLGIPDRATFNQQAQLLQGHESALPALEAREPGLTQMVGQLTRLVNVLTPARSIQPGRQAARDEIERE